MSNRKKNEIFKNLHLDRNRVYNSYREILFGFGLNPMRSRLGTMIFELVGIKLDLTKKEDVLAGIKRITKFRREQIEILNTLNLDHADFKREYNLVASSIIGLRAIDAVRNGYLDADSIEDMIEYEDDDSNPCRSQMVSLRIAEIELTKRLYELQQARFRCESVCKVTKAIIRELNALQSGF